MNNSNPIIVDLDGTFPKGDTLVEVIFQILFYRPVALVRVLFSLYFSKAFFKSELSSLKVLDAAEISVNTIVLN